MESLITSFLECESKCSLISLKVIAWGSASMLCLSLKVTFTTGFSDAGDAEVRTLKSTAQVARKEVGILDKKRRAGLALAAKGSNLTDTLVKYFVIITGLASWLKIEKLVVRCVQDEHLYAERMIARKM